jgi:hypothetical protein
MVALFNGMAGSPSGKVPIAYFLGGPKDIAQRVVSTDCGLIVLQVCDISTGLLIID